jgi:hypothetical protein
LIAGFFMRAGMRTVSPRVMITGSGNPSTRTCASPSSIVQTTGWSYGSGSSVPPRMRTLSSLK